MPGGNGMDISSMYRVKEIIKGYYCYYQVKRKEKQNASGATKNDLRISVIKKKRKELYTEVQQFGHEGFK